MVCEGRSPPKWIDMFNPTMWYAMRLAWLTKLWSRRLDHRPLDWVSGLTELHTQNFMSWKADLLSPWPLMVLSQCHDATTWFQPHLVGLKRCYICKQKSNNNVSQYITIGRGKLTTSQIPLYYILKHFMSGRPRHDFSETSYFLEI